MDEYGYGSILQKIETHSKWFWVLATPLALVLDLRPIWGNIISGIQNPQAASALFTPVLWSIGFLLTVVGVLFLLAFEKSSTGATIVWLLLGGALLALTPLWLIIFYGGLAGWYFLSTGIIAFKGQKRDTLPISVVIFLSLMLLFLLIVPAVPATGGPAPTLLNVPYLLVNTCLGMIALFSLLYTSINSSEGQTSVA